MTDFAPLEAALAAAKAQAAAEAVVAAAATARIADLTLTVARLRSQLAPPEVSVLSYGATGDGRTDDTAAIQRALDVTKAGTTLTFPVGYTFAHSGVLTIRNAGAKLIGGGTLLATAEATSSVWVMADNVSISGLTLRIAATSKRWDAWEQVKLRIGAVTGVRLTDVTIDGSAASGLYVGGASSFTFTRIAVKNTRADGIHFAEASHDGVLTDATVTGSGDDGISVVSYLASGLVHDIAITNPRVVGQVWGRGLSVVGGKNITLTNIYVEHSNAAALYISAEAEYRTEAVSGIVVNGGTINFANDNAAVDHGAVMLYNSQGSPCSDITIRDLTITDTRIGWQQFGIKGSFTKVGAYRLAFVRGPRLFMYGQAATGLNRTGWTYNGAAVPDHLERS